MSTRAINEHLEKKFLEDWQKLTFASDFIFAIIMFEQYFARAILALLLPEIGEIESVEVQKTINFDYESKGVRLDVCIKASGKTYNIEMQTSNKKNLAQRMRYYVTAIDADNMQKGCGYDELEEVFIIFLCTFDRYGKGLPRYTFKNTCQEDKNLLLEDGVQKIVFNAKAYDKEKNKELRQFLAYLMGVKVEFEEGSLVDKIDKRVQEIKNCKKWRQEFMKMQADRTDIYKEGFCKGFRKTKLKIAKKLLSILDDVTIANATGLSLKKIQKLRRKNLT